MLAVNPQQLDAKARDYYNSIKARIDEVSFSTLSVPFDRYPSERLSDEELKKRLALMYENNGVDDKTSPKSLLQATLPRDTLIDELTRIRSRTFRRLSDEALSDVQMTNALINTLRYRDK